MGGGRHMVSVAWEGMPYMHPSNSSTAPPSHLCLPGNSMSAAVGGAGDAPHPPPTPTVRMRDSDLDGSGSKKGVREGGGLPLLPLLHSCHSMTTFRRRRKRRRIRRQSQGGGESEDGGEGGGG